MSPRPNTTLADLVIPAGAEHEHGSAKTPRAHASGRGVSDGDCAQFIPPLLRGASIVEIDHTGIIVRHIEPLPGPNLHQLIAPALPGAFAHSITSSAREQRKRKGDRVSPIMLGSTAKMP